MFAKRAGGTNMKTVVILKQLPDEDKKYDYQDTERLNDSDVNVLKEALDLRDLYGGKVIAMLFGPPRGEDILKEAYTYGIDQAILVSDEVYKDLDIASVGKIMAAAIHEIGDYDLILCGRQAIDGDSAHMAAMLSGALEIPLLTYSDGIDLKDDHKISVITEGDRARYQAETNLPAMVLSIKEQHKLRFPAMEDIMKTYDGTYQVEILTDQRLKQPEYQKKVTQLRKYPMKQIKKKKLHMIDEISDTKKAERILEILKEKNVLSGEEILDHEEKKEIPIVSKDERFSVEQDIEENHLDDYGEVGNILVLAELYHGKILPITLELIKAGRKLADEIECNLSVMISGYNVKEEAQILHHYPIDEILYMEDQRLTEYHRQWNKEAISDCIRNKKPRAILVGATAMGRALAGEIAYILDSELIVDAQNLIYEKENDQIIVSRPAFDGEHMADFVIDSDHPSVITIRSGVMGRASYEEKIKGRFLKIDPKLDTKQQKYSVMYQEDHGEKQKEIDLEEAKLIVCGGRGMKGEEGFKMLQSFADKISAQVGCTRPCVDAGWTVYKQQIGQSGVSVKPKLYIGFGVAGALQHVTGITAECMIAINNNPRAAIFQYCDYGIVADAKKILEELQKKLEK